MTVGIITLTAEQTEFIGELAKLIHSKLVHSRISEWKQFVSAWKKGFKEPFEKISSYISSYEDDPNLNDLQTNEIQNELYRMSRSNYECVNALDSYMSQYYGLDYTTSPADIAEEIVQMCKEFSSVRVKFDSDRCPRCLYVTTDDITLETPDGHKVHLGKFDVQLNVMLKDRNLTFKAIKPNYPIYQQRMYAGQIANGSISQLNPHPHIRGVKLCEGDATAALTAAWKSGRFCDLFMMISAILNTYNPTSPYFRLEEWDRVKCQSCRGFYTADEMVGCSYCDGIMCPDCARNNTCSICGKIICNQHTGRRKVVQCNKCGEQVCITHYLSIRKHKCFKEIKEGWLADAQKTREMIPLLAMTAERSKEEEELQRIIEEERRIAIAEATGQDPGPTGYRNRM